MRKQTGAQQRGWAPAPCSSGPGDFLGIPFACLTLLPPGGREALGGYPCLAFSCVLGPRPGLAEQSKEEGVRPGHRGSRPSHRGPGRDRSSPKSCRGEWMGRKFGPLLRMFQKSLVSCEFCSINGEAEAVGPLCANITTHPCILTSQSSQEACKECPLLCYSNKRPKAQRSEIDVCPARPGSRL